MVGQTALHGVQTVVVAGLGLGEASTVRAVHHLHQSLVAGLSGGNLQGEGKLFIKHVTDNNFLLYI